MLEHRRMMAVVATDHFDYAPGSTAHIFASDFHAGEAVQFQVLHNDGTPNTGNGHTPWTVVDGGADDLDGLMNGNIHTTWYVDPDDSAGSSFDLTASGLTSGEFAHAFFTDDGNDSPTNITTQPGWLDVNGTNPVTTITAPAGFVITKVAIKSGSNSFAVPSPDNVDPGDDNTGDQHSGVIYVNGTYGLGNGFTVAGLGTGVVTVTKNAGTKDISHVDYMLGVAPTGGISGMKFNDLDGDGVKDPGDGGLSGWTIQLDKDANGTVDATTVTDANGNYSFTGLMAGVYRIREVNQVGWTQTTVNPGDVTVVSGTNSTGNNFGNFQLGGISGMKFNDLDGDGVKDPGDGGLSGWTIQLDKDANGTVDATTVTDANGNYSFTGLMAGVYRIREVNQVGWTQTTVNPGDVTVVSGTNSTGNDFGNTMCDVIVIGPDKQNTATSLVRVIDRRTGQVETQFFAYEPNFKGGVRLATGDMDGDGVDEIITAPGRGRAPEIRVFHQDGTELTQFRTMAYATNFTGGVEVAVGDVNGDGKNDIVTVPTYGVTEVRVFYNNYNPANPLADPIANVPNKQFQVFSNKFKGGADVTLADVGTFSNGSTLNALVPDGKSEIIVGNGPGMRSTIYVYDVTGNPTVVDTILPFDNKFKGGITLDAARINADLIPDFIVSAGNGGKSAIEIWDGRVNDTPDVRLAAFTAFGDQKTKNAPVHAVAVDTNGDGIADQIVAVQGTDGASGEIRTFSPAGVLQSKLTGFKGSWNIAKLRCHEPVLAEIDAFFSQLGA